MLVHVLLYDAGGDSEGIHSLELAGSTVVLMFENRDDAERYAGLLEAQDFPVPNIEAIDREEIEIFCRQAGYEARLVESGFVPTTDEERLLLAPPSANRDVSGWEDEPGGQSSQPVEQTDELEEFRRRLENLL
ncbi:DUF3110 domain-containing protein [Synechococcus sp. BS56D]|jgi:hypothetical protein|uniref:DUF3110 domain-containing protein n=1 Tax=Synechococcus sp. BS56D TaxID=2055944 RepID=UPI00103E1138|nr:DUF3110 domain-containing protein [Synechococcus sp. BS56D]NDD43909.1 DUF3110 domain-containing protein [Synechococcaceae bacterium WB9_4xB_025]TCD58489.1 DUF3110 domain-containing protein [Synechococcus sp. BS56D]